MSSVNENNEEQCPMVLLVVARPSTTSQPQHQPGKEYKIDSVSEKLFDACQLRGGATGSVAEHTVQ